MKKTGILLIQFIILLSIMLNGCQFSDSNSDTSPELLFDDDGNPIYPPTPTNTPLPTYDGTPTPDAPHLTSGSGIEVAIHTVTAGETLSSIAQEYDNSLATLLSMNNLTEADFVFVGQQLRIPATRSQQQGPSFKIIPDSELIYGPRAQGFDVRRFVSQFENGRLLTYQETVEGRSLAGPEIVSLVAHRYSVNPRLLLAILEHRSGWVTQSSNADTPYPVGYINGSATGLYKQLGWAANQLNWGYYGRSEGNLHSFNVGENIRIAYAADINDGTAGVQRMLGAHPNATQASWRQEVGQSGLFATFTRLFGNPFAYTVDPILLTNLAQPQLQLPWDENETWYYTSGPHGGWAAGSAWAALDFAPEAEQNGCIQSDKWVLAMADGIVTRSGFGAVVVDLDGDGFAGTGWAITYMHLETRDRIPIGTVVQTGDKLGHPSCEGGFSNGTHLHVARTVNGRWVSADGNIPFELGGWVSQGLGREYDGLLLRNGVSKEACACRDDSNTIQPQP